MSCTVILLILASSPGIAISCLEVVSFSAKTENCVRDKTGKQFCTTSESIRIAVTPQGQKICLLLKGPKGEAAGTLSLEVEKINLVCQKKVEYYSR